MIRIFYITMNENLGVLWQLYFWVLNESYFTRDSIEKKMMDLRNKVYLTTWIKLGKFLFLEFVGSLVFWCGHWSIIVTRCRIMAVVSVPEFLLVNDVGFFADEEHTQVLTLLHWPWILCVFRLDASFIFLKEEISRFSFFFWIFEFLNFLIEL